MQSSAPCTESENLYKNVYCAPSNSFPTRAVMEGNRMIGFHFVMEEESIKWKDDKRMDKDVCQRTLNQFITKTKTKDLQLRVVKCLWPRWGSPWCFVYDVWRWFVVVVACTTGGILLVHVRVLVVDWFLIFEVIFDSTWFLLGQSAMLFFWRLIVGVSVGLEVWWVTLIWVQQFLHHSQNHSSKPARLIFTVFLCLRGRSADSSSLASLSKTPSIQYACWASRRWQLWRTRPRYPFHILISPRSSKSSSSDEYVGLTLATPDLPIVKFSVLSS